MPELSARAMHYGINNYAITESQTERKRIRLTAFSALHSPRMTDYEIFEPFEKLVTIKICGTDRKVPENNSILRGLQFLDMEAISYGDFCWNGECINCQVWIRNGDKEKAVIACRVNVEEGMEILRMSEGMEIS